jgi:hypothetical protein
MSIDGITYLDIALMRTSTGPMTVRGGFNSIID